MIIAVLRGLAVGLWWLILWLVYVAPLLVWWKIVGLWTGNPDYPEAHCLDEEERTCARAGGEW